MKFSSTHHLKLACSLASLRVSVVTQKMKPRRHGEHGGKAGGICLLILLMLGLMLPLGAFAQQDTSRGDAMIAEYFRQETAKLTKLSLAEIQTKADWEQHKETYRRQLREMLGLDPFPERTPLKPVVTKTLEADEFEVECLHFQSRPGLYVTGNFYRPKKFEGKLPTILYVCGHGAQKKDGVSFGNKTTYQHHGAWFARNGYACLTIDTLQMGEIEGIHHGTYRYGMWWWNARGYSSAAVEAWNCIRALDYLETRPEVDASRIGVTGRSGGGAYSWWVAALDERIKVAVPVAGITSLQNHVVDGCVEGHCDCMYQVNTYRWDYPQIAALVAPRPLLISNTDKDRIFPLDGVVDVYVKTRRIYELLGAGNKVGLQIAEGPHEDTQNLQVHAFHWFNEHLKGEPTPQIETVAKKYFDPAELAVFPPGELPKDEINTKIQETFVPLAPEPKVPASKEEWTKQTAEWRKQLEEHCFRGWPTEVFPPGEGLDLKEAFSVTKEGIRLSAYDFTSQDAIQLRLYVARYDEFEQEATILTVLDDKGWIDFVAEMRTGFPEQFAEEVAVEKDESRFAKTKTSLGLFPFALAYVTPRGIGPTAWKQDQRTQTQVQRRFMLLGQTWEGMQVWDARRAVQAFRKVDGMKDMQLWLQGERRMAGIALYAAIFEPNIQRLRLENFNPSHHQGPVFLNVLRFLDIPQAVAMVAEKTPVRLFLTEKAGWEYPQDVAKALAWDQDQIQIRNLPASEKEPAPK